MKLVCSDGELAYWRAFQVAFDLDAELHGVSPYAHQMTIPIERDDRLQHMAEAAASHWDGLVAAMAEKQEETTSRRYEWGDVREECAPYQGHLCPVCKRNEASGPSPCPKKRELAGDDTACYCCEECRLECGMDI